MNVVQGVQLDCTTAVPCRTYPPAGAPLVPRLSLPTSAALRAGPAMTARFDGVASYAHHLLPGTKKAQNCRAAVPRAKVSVALIALTLWALPEDPTRSGVPTGVHVAPSTILRGTVRHGEPLILAAFAWHGRLAVQLARGVLRMLCGADVGGGGSTGTLPLLKLAPAAMRCAAGPALREGWRVRREAGWAAPGASIDQTAVVRSGACYLPPASACAHRSGIYKTRAGTRGSASSDPSYHPQLPHATVPIRPSSPFDCYCLHSRRTHL